ncbi:MAG: hypothetical protein AAF849_04850 [Bacteroidota bacterium]
MSVETNQSKRQDHLFSQAIRSEGKSIEIYLDADSVIQMMLGIREFMLEDLNVKSTSELAIDEKKTKRFNERTTLVHALMYNERLKPLQLHMLVPHQKELLLKLQSLSTTPHNKKHAKLFYKRFINNKINIQIPAKKSSYDQAIDYYEQVEGEILDIYKIDYLVKEGIEWRTRLKHIKDNILSLDEEEYDYVRLGKSELFNDLYDKFKELRKRKKRYTNLTDALVLCVLREKIKEYKKQKGRQVIPIFYDTNGFFLKAVEKAGLSEKFMIDIDGVSYSILRDSDFLLLHAILVADQFPSFSSIDNNISISSSFKVSEDALDDQFAQYFTNIKEDYSKNIEKYITSNLLHQFWTKDRQEISEDLREFIQYDRFREIIVPKIEEEIAKYRRELQENVRIYSLYVNLYVGMERVMRAIEKGLRENLDHYQDIDEIDVFENFDINRFAIQPKEKKRIRDLGRRLFLEDDKNRRLSVYTDVIESIYIGLEDKDHESLVVGMTILWMLGCYRLIVEILEEINFKYDYYSLAAIHASALAFELNTHPKAKEKIARILRMVDTHTDPKTGEKNFAFEVNYKTALGAATVYFQLWRKSSKEPFYTLAEDLRSPAVPSEEKDYNLIRAKQLIDDAISWMEEGNRFNEKIERERYYYYLLNLSIYYVTMGFPDEDFLQLNSKVSILAKAKQDNTEFFIHLYSDTLSLYNLRRAVLAIKAKNKADFDYFIDLAKKDNEAALEEVLKISIQKYYKEIKIKIGLVENKGRNIFNQKS